MAGEREKEAIEGVFKKGSHERATLEARIRIEALETALRETQKLATESRAENSVIKERLSSITDWQRRQNGDIAANTTAMNNLSLALSNKIEDVTKSIQKLIVSYDGNIDKLCRDYDERFTKVKTDAASTEVKLRQKIQDVELGLIAKFDENKNYFSRWFIGIAVGIIVSMTLIILSRVWTVPGGHL